MTMGAAAPEQLRQPAAGGGATSASSSSPAAVRVLDTALVHPSSPGGPAPPETSLPLTFFDALWLPSPPVERVFLYRLAADADAAVDNLRDSLSHAVRAFFPLAGRLRLTPGAANRYELHYQRAKSRGDSGNGSSDRTILLIPVDHRSRLEPPLPDEYFGNCIGPALAIASGSELLAEEAGASGLLAACTAIAVGIAEALSGVATENMGERKARLRELAATMAVLSVAGSPRLRVYDLDFGFGRPAKVDILSVAKTGAIAVAESRAGDGGIEVGVCLPPEGMDAFRKCFADALAGLCNLEVKR